MEDQRIDFEAALQRAGITVQYDASRGWTFTVADIEVQADFRTPQEALEGILCFLVQAYEDTIQQGMRQRATQKHGPSTPLPHIQARHEEGKQQK